MIKLNKVLLCQVSILETIFQYLVANSATCGEAAKLS